MFGIPIGKVRLEGKSPGTLRGNFALINEAGGQTELMANERHVRSDSGFDVVIGISAVYPHSDSQEEGSWDLVDFYKEEYESAGKGNYDIYVVFIEARATPLKVQWTKLAYICPHKFFNQQYGEPVRALIAKGKHLRHVVHFGDEQVFPGATIYTCLLFLSQKRQFGMPFRSGSRPRSMESNPGGVEGKFPSTLRV